MYVRAGTKAGDRLKLVVLEPKLQVLHKAYEADTKKGFFSEYTPREDNPKKILTGPALVDRKTCYTFYPLNMRRWYNRSFDLVDKKTGKVVASFRRQ